MSMYSVLRAMSAAILVIGVSAIPVLGDEAPKQVDTKGLQKLGDEWKEKNPLEGNKTAIEVGAAAYNSNCARCHGLEMISGGIVPDLRHVPLGQEGDDLFKTRMQKGAQHNGTTVMPVFNGLLPQETLWSIRSFMVSKHIED